MRPFITIAIFFFSLHAIAQYPANWRKAPQNPIPLQYTADHYLLYHNIKSVVYSEGETKMIFHFDEKGNTSALNTGYDNILYKYDSNGYLKLIKNNYTTAHYKTNELGYIIEENYGDGSGSQYRYNDKGLFSEKIDLKTGISTEKYSYDDQNRLLIMVLFNTDGSMMQRNTYAYQDQITYIQVTENIVSASGKHTKNNYFYSKRGERLSSDHKNDIITYDAKSNATSHYKSSNQLKATFDIIYY